MVRDKAISEDLTQNVFVKVMKYRTSYKGGKFVSWIFRIARNLFSDHYQKQKMTQNNIDATYVEDDMIGVDENRTEDVSHLYQALNHLKVEDRELIVMNRLQGIKYDRIAEITESTEGAVKVKVHRIINKLRTVYFETL